MAYFDTTSPAGVLSREITATRNAFAALGRGIHRAMHAMIENSSMNLRVKKAHALQAKSDAELAALGIRREDIVRRVFSDIHHL